MDADGRTDGWGARTAQARRCCIVTAGGQRLGAQGGRQGDVDVRDGIMVASLWGSVRVLPSDL